MGKKVVIAGLSTILLVAAVIGVIAVTIRSSKPNPQNLSVSSKAVSLLCAPTEYKDVCESTLLSANINESSTTGDVIRAAVGVITAEIQYASQKAHELHGQAQGPIDNDGFEFCKQLLEDAGDKLAAVLLEADKSHRIDDFQAWLSMVISYRTNCLASIEAPELNNQMTDALRNATELTDNAIAIVTAFGELAEDVNLGFNASGEAYPSWMQAGGRRLLASRVARPAMRPNAVVANDGSGQFRSINAALNAMPKTYRGRYVIYVKAGVYNEKVTIDKYKPNVLIYGDGPRRTVVTGKLNYAEGVGTYKTATFSVEASGFIARSMGFSNTAGPKGHQAVALRINADAAVVYNCRIDGFQDSFYSQSGRHFVRNTVISGTIDFIFGDSQLVIQNSLIILRRPMDNQQNTVTAHGKATPNERTGIVIQNCRIVADRSLYPDRFRIPSFLGRPWKEYSTTVVMESTIGDHIRPEGWMEWNGNFALDTLFYAEYNNRGPGSPTARRVRWKGFHVINRREASRWTAGMLLAGRAWIPYSAVPYVPSLFH